MLPSTEASASLRQTSRLRCRTGTQRKESSGLWSTAATDMARMKRSWREQYNRFEREISERETPHDDGAVAEASKEVARAVGGTEGRPAPPAAPVPQAAVERQGAEGADPLRRYMERLEQSVSDPDALQVRNAAIAPKKNAMCAEFSARDKAGIYAGFKRVIVTEITAIPEEPPLKETVTKFLAFQAAARD